MTTARTESDDADFARAIRLRPQKRDSSSDVTHHLIVCDSPCSPYLRTNIVRTAQTITKVQMRGNRRIAVMGEVGLPTVAVVADKSHCFGNQGGV